MKIKLLLLQFFLLSFVLKAFTRNRLCNVRSFLYRYLLYISCKYNVPDLVLLDVWELHRIPHGIFCRLPIPDLLIFTCQVHRMLTLTYLLGPFSSISAACASNLMSNSVWIAVTRPTGMKHVIFLM